MTLYHVTYRSPRDNANRSLPLVATDLNEAKDLALDTLIAAAPDYVSADIYLYAQYLTSVLSPTWSPR